MRLRRLQLFDYRNFQRLNVGLDRDVALFIGDNAQGKSNLLEAVYLLATMRGLRTETDVQFIRRESLEDVMPAARVVGEIEAMGGPLKLEVAIVARPGAGGFVATKTVRVNGAPRRLGDAVGRLTAVLFSADDLLTVAGAPSLRRRHLDLMLVQVDPQYATARSRFERVLAQRNHLLKRIREGEAQPDELVFWDSELARDGGLVSQRRAVALAELGELATGYQAALAPSEKLQVTYQPRIEPLEADLSSLPAEDAAHIYSSALKTGLGRDIAAGMTLQGPHRDDIGLELNGLPAAGYASRAQQRTIALALRLAEAQLLLRRRGDPPVLLLDDVLSEMDAPRRRSVLSALSGMDQMLITGTDQDRFPSGFSAAAASFAVQSGTVRPLSPDPAGD